MSSLRYFAITLASVLLATGSAGAESGPESPADLIAKNLAARGGAAKLAALSSIEFSGKLLEDGEFELSYKELRARKNNAARIEASIQGLTLVQAYDGQSAWRINPFEGRRDAERMSADEARALADDATIDGQLLSAKARGSTVSYLGREDFEGTDAYKLRVVDPNGAQYDYYLDPDTYLEIKLVETRKLRGAPQITVTEYGDYELVDGVYFPFAIESGPAGSTASGRSQTTIESARANPPVTAATFAMPATPSAK